VISCYHNFETSVSKQTAKEIFALHTYSKSPLNIALENNLSGKCRRQCAQSTSAV